MPEAQLRNARALREMQQAVAAARATEKAWGPPPKAASCRPTVAQFSVERSQNPRRHRRCKTAKHLQRPRRAAAGEEVDRGGERGGERAHGWCTTGWAAPRAGSTAVATATEVSAQ
eukprot:6793209-Pyramimonas_sp.AAC.1